MARSREKRDRGGNGYIYGDNRSEVGRTVSQVIDLMVAAGGLEPPTRGL